MAKSRSDALEDGLRHHENKMRIKKLQKRIKELQEEADSADSQEARGNIIRKIGQLQNQL